MNGAVQEATRLVFAVVYHGLIVQSYDSWPNNYYNGGPQRLMPDVSSPKTYRNLLEVQVELQLPNFYLLVDYLVRRQKDTDSKKY